MSAIVLDLGVIADQTLGRRAVNLISPSASGRLNGLSTGLFFLGGASGSALAGIASERSGWTLVCMISAACGMAALALTTIQRSPTKQSCKDLLRRADVMKIFLAGATGVIGKRLIPLLLNAGHNVVGTTRSTAKRDALRAMGVEPVVVDVFDALALSHALAIARPDLVMHQLTDLPPGLDPKKMAEGIRRNARLRSEGTKHLVAAALECGAPRLVAQSIAWMYAPGPEPHSEDDPLDIGAADSRAITVNGVATLERLTLSSPPIEGVVLRYGRLYGPNTGAGVRAEPPALHVDAAASAALLAIEKGTRGIYNVAEPEWISLYREGT